MKSVLVPDTIPPKIPENNSLCQALYQCCMSSTDDDRPATQKDLALLRTELRGEMAELRTELRGEMAELRTELRGDMETLRAGLQGEMSRMQENLIERMRDMQTEVLRAFHGWASPLEIRLRVLPGMQERLTLLEDRVSALERRPQN